MRKGQLRRRTRETRVNARVILDGQGKGSVSTGVGFFDHMLELFAHHGLFDLTVRCKGDLNVDDHHTVEDVALAVGGAFRNALGKRSRITRFGSAYVPMDEALARCAVDLGGRPSLVFNATFKRAKVGDLSTEMVRHFFESFAGASRANIHIEVIYGVNTHHKIEAIFKAFALAMHDACRINRRLVGIPSTKGSL
jgi:imidazoleglycerol phosphate dehydratase HisB